LKHSSQPLFELVLTGGSGCPHEDGSMWGLDFWHTEVGDAGSDE
jgi:hypothetical protein